MPFCCIVITVSYLQKCSFVQTKALFNTYKTVVLLWHCPGLRSNKKPLLCQHITAFKKGPFPSHGDGFDWLFLQSVALRGQSAPTERDPC